MSARVERRFNEKHEPAEDSYIATGHATTKPSYVEVPKTTAHEDPTVESRRAHFKGPSQSTLQDDPEESLGECKSPTALFPPEPFQPKGAKSGPTSVGSVSFPEGGLDGWLAVVGGFLLMAGKSASAV
jgi:hypothetical protein